MSDYSVGERYMDHAGAGFRTEPKENNADRRGRANVHVPGERINPSGGWVTGTSLGHGHQHAEPGQGAVDDRAAAEPNDHHDELIEHSLIFESVVAALYDEARELLLAKHADYGPKNISDAPGGALNGLRVRIHDKFARLNHLIDTQRTDETAISESIEDTLIDLANYALIAVLVRRGAWPK